MSHSPFPYYIDPHVPTAVFDANGWKFAATTPGQMFPEIDPETAADNAALIAAIPAMVAVLKAYEQWEADIIMERKCWGGPMPMQITDNLFERMIEIQYMRNAALASIGKTP